MTARSLAAHLIDFSDRPGPVATPPSVAPARNDLAITQARADGFREGHAAGLARADADCTARVADVEAQALAHLVAARATWVDDVTSSLKRQLDGSLTDLQESVTASVARVLIDVAAIARRTASVDAMVACLRPLLRDRVVRLDVAGPADLLTALCERLDGYAIEQRQTAADAELRVRIDGTTLETRLATWRETLLEALEITS